MQELTADTFDDFINSNEVVLVDFWAEWCGPCKQMEPILQHLSKDHVIAKVNVDEEFDLIDRFEIQAMPTFLIFSNGKVTDRHIGATSRSVVESWLA